MKRFLILTILLSVVFTSTRAVPAQPGVWRTMTLHDNSVVEVQLVGDECLHYWQAADGRMFDDYGQALNHWDLQQRLLSSNKRRMSAARRQGIRREGIHRESTSTIPIRNYEGEKRGLIILVAFQNKAFCDGHDQALYDRIANEKGFASSDGFRGSVHDYFLDQSRGLFDLTFDVVGPVLMPNDYGYYGENGGPYDFDLHPGEMVVTACQAIVDEVNFRDYDWDGNGEVDQVMIIYAGRGEASGGGANTVWPHEWCLTEAEGAPLELDGVRIDTYACSCEMRSDSSIDGIGTTCHEFSHCLGLPDMYDIDYGGNFGMGSYSLMDHGSYNGNSFLPAGYTSFERMCCGWLTPTVLTDNMEVANMKALSDGGEAYILYNDAWPDEFYLLENRQETGWDQKIPESGMLILHVDYDETVWYYNLVNTAADYSDKEGYGPGAVNDHERCTIFHADGYDYGFWASPYPYYSNNSLTPDSQPAAILYHPNSQGKTFMSVPILDITQNSNGIMSFHTGEATGIAEMRDGENERRRGEDAWYSLDGRRVHAQGTMPGRVYIYKGKKVKR